MTLAISVPWALCIPNVVPLLFENIQYTHTHTHACVRMGGSQELYPDIYVIWSFKTKLCSRCASLDVCLQLRSSHRATDPAEENKSSWDI